MRKIAITIVLLLIIFLMVGMYIFLKNIIFYKINTPYYMLVVGVDSVNVKEKFTRTDSIMIIGINKEKKVILVLPVPRDLIVEVNNEKLRINAVAVKFGFNKLIELLENMLDIKISDYLVFDYGLFKTVGDMIAPVKIVVEKPMYYEDYHQNLHIKFEPGENLMDGEKLLHYVRFRNDPLGDIGRVRRQKKAVFAMLERAKELGFKKLIKIAETVIENTKTSLNLPKAISLYRLTKDLNIEFITFRSRIQGPYLVASDSDIKYMRKYVKNFEKPQEERKIWVTVIRNVENFHLSFYTVTREKWRGTKGFLLEIVDIFPDLPNIIEGENYVIFKDYKIKDKVLNILESRYGKVNVIDPEKYPDIYFAIIDFLSKNSHDPLYSDVFFLAGST